MCIGVPGRVIQIVDPGIFLADVEVAGVVRKVNLGLLPEDEAAGPGDYVLVHIGFALGKITEEEAIDTQRMIDGIGEEQFNLSTTAMEST